MDNDDYDRKAIELTIVICTYNRYDFLPRAIDSIERQDLAKCRFELIVIDNSDDEERRSDFVVGLDLDLNCMYIIEPRKGLSIARNKGVEYASGALIAFIDDDAIADRNWASAIVAAFGRSSRIGVAGGPVKAIWPLERPTWLHPWQEGFLTIVDRGDTARPTDAGEWLAGTNIAFRTDLIRKFGGFHEGLGRIGKLLLSNEEIVLCENIAAAGNEIWYFPEIRVLHRVHPERVSQSWMRRRVAFQVLSEILHDEKDEFEALPAIHKLLEFFDTMPARSRNLSGLFTDVQEAEQFQGQTAALAAMIRLALLDGGSWERTLEAAT